MKTKFNLKHNIIQAPMAGVTTPKFIAACAEAGILGSIGAGYLSGHETKLQIQEVKKLTNRPFQVNVFVQDEPKIDVNVLYEARMALQPIYDELNIKEVPSVVSTELFSGQIEAIVEEKVPIVSFTFGLPDKSVMERLHEYGAFLIGTATTLDEARAVEKHGFDAVVLQGSEAGGHRGSFIDPLKLIPVRQLLQDIHHQISIPVIAAGGIMNKEHMEEMLALGADYVQIGTALLTADECEVNKVYKQAIIDSKEADTCITMAFTGKAARGLKNTFTEQLKSEVVAPYPIQHHLTSKIRQVSGQLGRAEYLSLWMGENSYMATAAKVKDIVAQFE